jgi:hypothetical protein
VVVWLGGNSLHWPSALEFNLRQDLYASRLLLEPGVALVHVPCANVADHLITTRAEIDHFVRPAGKTGEFLARRYAENVSGAAGVSKVIWDLAAVGYHRPGPQPGPHGRNDVVVGSSPAPHR